MEMYDIFFGIACFMLATGGVVAFITIIAKSMEHYTNTPEKQVFMLIMAIHITVVGVMGFMYVKPSIRYRTACIEHGILYADGEDFMGRTVYKFKRAVATNTASLTAEVQ